MANIKLTTPVMVALVLMIMSAILPMALGMISAAGDQVVSINGTEYLVSTLVDSNVLTLLTVLIPILAIVGIALAFVPKIRG